MCRRWRCVIFQSPLLLNLQLVCTRKTRADSLDIWRPLPFLISDASYHNTQQQMDNIIAALKHNGRVCEIHLIHLRYLEFEYLTGLTSMQTPFPELTGIYIEMLPYDRPMPRFPIPFPSRSWADLHHVYEHIRWRAFHFRDHRSYFCLPLTSLISTSLVFPVPDPRTVHSRRWPPASLLYVDQPRVTRPSFSTPATSPCSRSRRPRPLPSSSHILLKIEVSFLYTPSDLQGSGCTSFMVHSVF